MPSVQDLLKQTKQQISEITTEQLAEKLKKDPDLALVDVREKDEQERGTIPNAKLIPRGFLELKIEDALPDKKKEVVLYCAGGNRSAFAAQSLQALGYTKVHSLIGGYTKWANEGRATLKQTFLDSQKVERYSRHITMPEVGEAGQI